MKFVKKLTALFLAVCMVMAMGITAFAADQTFTIKTASDDTHNYKVYQIFTGDLSSDKTTLSNIKAGQNFKTSESDKDAAAKKAAEELAKIEASASDSTKLTSIKNYVDLTGEEFGSVNANGGSLSVPAGYYLIMDKDDLSGKDDAYTTYIVKVANDVTIERKADKPTVEKKVKDINDSTETQKSDWKDSADHDVKDVIDFKLTATLPADEKDFAAYSSYKLVFHDVQSEGLTFNSDSVVVKYDGTTITSGYRVVTNPTDECTFEVVLDDVKSIEGITVAAGKSFTVEYNSTLNEKAVIGSAGNPNKVKLEYSNNPNGEGNGVTPEDKVIVFTYEVDVNKVNANKQPLAGAGFTLYKFDKTTNDYVAVGAEITASQQADGKYTSKFLRVDDGKYKLVETTVPDGYNKVDDIEFEISATHTDGDAPELTVLTATGFTTVKTESGSITGVLSQDVINNKGSELPSTGGMGTTVIYIAGIAMIVAAGVVVIARKRMA